MKRILAFMAKICAVAKKDTLSVEVVDAEIAFDNGKVLPIDIHAAVLLLRVVVEKTIIEAFLAAPRSDGKVEVTVEINSPTHVCYWSHSIDYAAFCYEWPNAFLDGLIMRKPIIEKLLADALTAMLDAHVNMTERKVGDGYEVRRRY